MSFQRIYQYFVFLADCRCRARLPEHSFCRCPVAQKLQQKLEGNGEFRCDANFEVVMRTDDRGTPNQSEHKLEQGFSSESFK